MSLAVLRGAFFVPTPVDFDPPTGRSIRSTNNRSLLQLRRGPELDADGFSSRSAFFFSHLSGTMYLTPDLVEEHFRDLGIDEFHWFTVRGRGRWRVGGEGRLGDGEREEETTGGGEGRLKRR